MSQEYQPQNDLPQLLEALYAEADHLSEADWRTEHLTEFQTLCRSKNLEQADRERQLETVKTRVNHWWDRYRSLEVTERERTAETLAGHRLLVEGLAGWLEAVELCRQGDLESAQEAAIEANRLLILVQRQSRRLSNALGPYPGSPKPLVS